MTTPLAIPEAFTISDAPLSDDAISALADFLLALGDCTELPHLQTSPDPETPDPENQI